MVVRRRVLVRRPRRGRRRRRRSGRRGVLELLLGAEQRVERLLAQVLRDREREPGADDAEQDELAEAAAASLRFLGASRSATDASLKDSAAALMSFCSFLSSKICFVGCLPFWSRPTASRADS